MYQVKKRCVKLRASSIDPKRVGNSGRYFNVLNWHSLYGLSLLTCGREWVLVTPRSERSRATGFDAIDLHTVLSDYFTDAQNFQKWFGKLMFRDNEEILADAQRIADTANEIADRLRPFLSSG